MNRNDTFSVRMGFEPAQTVQITELDKSTRVALLNFMNMLFPVPGTFNGPGVVQMSWRVVLSTALKIPDDEIRQSHPSIVRDKYNSIYLDWEFHQIFNLIENFFANLGFFTQDTSMKDKFHVYLNNVLTENNVGYRFMEGRFVPLTGEAELRAVDMATKTPYQSANRHVKKAVALFADRENPDYANSMKESISAAEAAVRELTGDENATLGAGIKRLEKSGVNMHPAFKDALLKLYGFASDAGGIRHAGKGEAAPYDRQTAHFMLVTCSAFVNYIAANAPEK